MRRGGALDGEACQAGGTSPSGLPAMAGLAAPQKGTGLQMGLKGRKAVGGRERYQWAEQLSPAGVNNVILFMLEIPC